MVVGGRENETVLTVTSKLVFIHYLQHCALTASGQQLPKWGFEQQEISCNPNLRDKNAHWNVEDNVFAKCTRPKNKKKKGEEKTYQLEPLQCY